MAMVIQHFKIFTLKSGSDPGPYTPTPGSDFQLYWYLHRENETISDATIIAANQRVPVTRPYTLEFLEADLPQPGDPSYDGTAMITFYWGSINYVMDFSAEETDDDQNFILDKLDQDIRI